MDKEPGKPTSVPGTWVNGDVQCGKGSCFLTGEAVTLVSAPWKSRFTFLELPSYLVATLKLDVKRLTWLSSQRIPRPDLLPVSSFVPVSVVRFILVRLPTDCNEYQHSRDKSIDRQRIDQRRRN